MVYFRALETVNLFDSEDLNCDRLATQMARGRYLMPLVPASPNNPNSSVWVELWEDGYRGWIKPSSWADLQPILEAQPAWAIALSADEIQARIPQVIDYIFCAQAQPHEYLWGGTVPPNFDCSGLVQAAFASAGVWLPRDAYQQEAFTHSLGQGTATRGDLIFFGEERATHVGLYLGNGEYIHCSGKAQGHNGIAIDSLDNHNQLLRGWGRIANNLRGGNYCVP